MNIPADALTWPHIVVVCGLVAAATVYGIACWWTDRCGRWRK